MRTRCPTANTTPPGSVVQHWSASLVDPKSCRNTFGFYTCAKLHRRSSLPYCPPFACPNDLLFAQLDCEPAHAIARTWRVPLSLGVILGWNPGADCVHLCPCLCALWISVATEFHEHDSGCYFRLHKSTSPPALGRGMPTSLSHG